MRALPRPSTAARRLPGLQRTRTRATGAATSACCAASASQKSAPALRVARANWSLPARRRARSHPRGLGCRRVRLDVQQEVTVPVSARASASRPRVIARRPWPTACAFPQHRPSRRASRQEDPGCGRARACGGSGWSIRDPVGQARARGSCRLVGASPVTRQRRRKTS